MKKGRKGEGRIYLRGRTYWLRIRINGIEKNISLGTKDLAEAKEEAKKHRSISTATSFEEISLKIAQAKRLASAKSIKISEAWTRFEASSRRPDSSQGTLKNYRRMWKALDAWVSVKRPNVCFLAQIDDGVASSFAESLWSESDISASTYNQYIKALALICRVLGEDAGMRSNPWRKITRKIETHQRRLDFSTDQVRKLLSCFQDPRLAIIHKMEMRLLFFLGAYTGMRLETAALLTWEKIDLKKGVIRAIPVKTRRLQREITVPIHPELKTELEAASPQARGRVLPALSARYEAMPAKVKEDILKTLDFCELSERNKKPERGITRRLYGFHSFRHFFASTCANQGVPITTLTEILGDNVATLQRYYMHASDAGRSKALAALPSSVASEREKILAELNEILAATDEKKLKAILEDIKKAPSEKGA